MFASFLLVKLTVLCQLIHFTGTGIKYCKKTIILEVCTLLLLYGLRQNVTYRTASKSLLYRNAVHIKKKKDVVGSFYMSKETRRGGESKAD